MRLVIASFNFIGRRHDVLQNAVNAEANAVFLFVRLHVNVARAPFHGVGQNQVDELDDGRFLGGLLQGREVHLGFFGRKLQRGFFARQVLHYLVELFDALDVAVELVDCFADGGFRRHYRLDVEAGHELDIVHREDVGRIGHRDREGRSHARKRHNLIADGGFLRHKLDDGWIDFVEFQIDRRARRIGAKALR